ncbi:MAG TPA: DNA-binding protein, partial [Paenibacillus sp.]
MSPATTIRAEIINHITSFGHTFSSFGLASGINKGVISAILNNNPPKPISVRQIDLITKALGYAEGALYDLYVGECFVNEKPNGRRISSFLVRCAELGKEDTIAHVLSRLMENLTYLPLIFSIAERLYISGKTKESIIFYICVAEHEKYQHSERLAISQYRIFRASIGLDAEQNMEATLQFIAYRKRLPENYQLDALLQLMDIYYTMNKWEKAEYYADESIALSTIVLQNEKRKKLGNRPYEQLVTDKPLVNYYAYGYLMKGVALQKQGRYEEALKYVAGYADLSWVEGLDQEGRLIVEKYHMWAIANKYTLEILMGNESILPQYTQLLQDNPQEILPGLLTIMESANQHGFSVDDILEQFNDAIQEYEKEPFSYLSNGYSDVSNKVKYANFCYQIAIYQFSNKRYREAIKNTLQSLTINDNINKKSEVIDSMSLFDIYRNFATEEELKEYDRFIKGGCNHESSDSFVNSS